jgi:hypothetical protein
MALPAAARIRGRVGARGPVLDQVLNNATLARLAFHPWAWRNIGQWWEKRETRVARNVPHDLARPAWRGRGKRHRSRPQRASGRTLWRLQDELSSTVNGILAGS